MKAFEEYPEILDTEEIMEIFDISRASAYRLMRRKDFPAFKIAGRFTVQKRTLIKWLDRQERLGCQEK